MTATIQSRGDGLIRTLITERLGIAFLIAISLGCALAWRYPFPTTQPFLQYIGQERPLILAVLRWSYTVFLFSTPFLFASMLGSLGYVHLYQPKQDIAAGSLPAYPKASRRDELFAVLGEIHQRLEAKPSNTPRWLTIPERGLYTGIAVFGSIGTGKTQGVILPLMRQLFAYNAYDDQKKLSGLVLEVKGDLCRQLASVMSECGRDEDYVEVSLESKWRYNPLQSDLDAYALAYNIASHFEDISETEGRIVRREGVLFAQERSVHHPRIRWHQPAATDILHAQAGLPADSNELV
jgi:hypothetical protein